MATFLPSISTVVVQSVRLSPERPIFGSGVGTNGAGGPGILQTFGTVAGAVSVLPSVTGVLGGFTATDGITRHPPCASADQAGRLRDGHFPNSSRAESWALSRTGGRLTLSQGPQTGVPKRLRRPPNSQLA